MSGRPRRPSVKWESSTEEDDVYDSKYRMRLRESQRNMQQPSTGPFTSSVTENNTALESRKRGRGPSKRPCLNRNALMARENRLKKKVYLEEVENKLSFYQQENKNLLNTIKKQSIDIKRLSGEVSYLRSVLNNNTSITALLKTINDGLRKMSAQKNAFHLNHASEGPDQSVTRCKYTCCTNAKENILSSQNTNIFITNANNDPLMEHSATESQTHGYYVNPKKHVPCKNSAIDKISSAFLDPDHTYTVLKYSAVDIKSEPESKNAANAISSTTSSTSENSYLDSGKELGSLLPFPQADLPNAEQKKDTCAIGIDLDQLPTFNMDIFEDLPKCDEILNTVESLNDTSNLFMEEEISQNVDNTGICLHVNSDTVSLEFCSVCHLNSKSSGLN
ncbi:uncharacterized protein LOC143370131 isoform X1 [Andrena cerasifolii]|uniref:uncharacterized protein LOC143370131 isoform X1 n=1 Tax=Andrena cerasifolii TaxID=2819439 RepID=UPI004037E1C4